MTPWCCDLLRPGPLRHYLTLWRCWKSCQASLQTLLIGCDGIVAFKATTCDTLLCLKHIVLLFVHGFNRASPPSALVDAQEVEGRARLQFKQNSYSLTILNHLNCPCLILSLMCAHLQSTILDFTVSTAPCQQAAMLPARLPCLIC